MPVPTRSVKSVLLNYPKALLVKRYQTVTIPGSPSNPAGYSRQIPYYTFTKPAAHLLSLVTGVSKFMILERTYIMDPGETTLPWYNPHRGGGGITLGDGGRFNIRFTANYFNDDPKSFSGHGKGGTHAFLNIASHEVVHIGQNIDHGSLKSYVWEFVCQYAMALGHDGARYEKEASHGTWAYQQFKGFVDDTFGGGTLIGLLENSVSDNYKIVKIDLWWRMYITFLNGSNFVPRAGQVRFTNPKRRRR